MKSKIVLTLLFISGTGTLSDTHQTASAKQSLQPFLITISSMGTEVKTGSLVDIKVQLTNTSNREMMLGAGFQVYGNIDPMYSYDCRDAEGRRIKKDFPIIGSLGDRAVPTLKPGKTQEEIVTVSTACDFSHPGHYTIQLSRSIAGKPKDGVVKSNKITVTVIP